MALTLDRVKIGTRASRMALNQAARVQGLLQQHYPALHFELVTITTRGDAQPHRTLRDFQRPGIFTSALTRALNECRIHVAVHSFKDLPVQMPCNPVLGAVLQRDDPSDALVTYRHTRIADLPAGARIGTSSPRRERMVRSLNRDWQVVPIRGNVDTRLAQLDAEQKRAYDGVIVATCGLYRLGLAHRIVHRFDVNEFLTAPAQGAVAVQCRATEPAVRELLAILNHEPTYRATMAERGLLYHLGGGCALPTAAYARVDGQHIELHGRIWSPDGRDSIRSKAQGSDPHRVSQQLAAHMMQQGCQAWLVHDHPT